MLLRLKILFLALLLSVPALEINAHAELSDKSESVEITLRAADPNGTIKTPRKTVVKERRGPHVAFSFASRTSVTTTAFGTPPHLHRDLVIQTRRLLI